MLTVAFHLPGTKEMHHWVNPQPYNLCHCHYTMTNCCDVKLASNSFLVHLQRGAASDPFHASRKISTPLYYLVFLFFAFPEKNIQIWPHFITIDVYANSPEKLAALFSGQSIDFFFFFLSSCLCRVYFPDK